MSLRFVITYGPALQDASLLQRIADQCECIFRINGAHASVETAREIVHFLRASLQNPKILIDLPGNKIRTAQIPQSIPVGIGRTITLLPHQFNYTEFYKYLKAGHKLLAQDSTLLFEVSRSSCEGIELISHSNGELMNNKGIHLKGSSDHLPFLFEKDLELIECAIREGVYALGLSFVRNCEDIQQVAALTQGHPIELFSKVEKHEAIENLDSILDLVHTIIIDRGDLSADVGMLELPYLQERILHKAKGRGRNVILATQFLKSMENQSVPLIAEVLDLYSTLHKDIWGIQLSDETAVGKYPAECVEFIIEMYRKIYGVRPHPQLTRRISTVTAELQRR